MDAIAKRVVWNPEFKEAYDSGSFPRMRAVTFLLVKNALRELCARPGLTKQDLLAIVKFQAEGLSVREIARRTGFHRSTVHYHLKKMEEAARR